MPTLDTGKHVLRDHHAGQVVDAVPSVTGNVWIDVNCIRKGVDYYVRYPSSAPSGRIVVLDAGPFGKFTGTNTRGITIQHGQTVRFRRTSRNTYDVVSPSSVTGRSSSFNIAPRRILIVGQSLGQEWEHSPAVSAFLDRLSVLGDTTPTSFVHMCTGGSAALKEHRPDATRFWWDYDAPASGPLNSAVCSDIDGMSASEKPTHVYFIQGEQDGGVYAGLTEEKDAAFRQRYAHALTKVLSIMRAYVNSDRYSIPAFVQILGTRASGERRGMPIVRCAQWDFIGTPGMNAHVGAVNPMDLPLKDDVHPTGAGYAILGELWADAFFAACAKAT